MKIRGLGKTFKVALLPLAFLSLLMGFASPVYLTVTSRETLESVGQGSPTLSKEAEQQLRENNIGPVELLLPLLGSDEAEKLKVDVEQRKEANQDLAVSGGGSIFDMLTFKDYFGGLDDHSRELKRFSAYFVFNRAATRGDLWERLEQSSSNKNVQAVLASTPKDGRPGAFWARVLDDPNITSFSGTKLIKLENFRFFPDRHLLLSIATFLPEEADANSSEAEIRNLCLARARGALSSNDSETPRGFTLSREGEEMSLEVNASVEQSPFSGNLDLATIAPVLPILKSGRTKEGAYQVILGGVLDTGGKPEQHGRWLPYPMLIPMMVGTAMSIEKDYFSAEVGFELGKLSQGLLAGDLASKEKLRAFYWALYQLARKLNFIQMSELTKCCPDLKSVFDVAALLRMRNRPVSEATGKIKAKRYELRQLVREEAESRKSELDKLYRERESAENVFRRELSVIYASCLLSDDPSAVFTYIENYPVFNRGGDDNASIAALQDLETAMAYGGSSLAHLLEMERVVHRPGAFLNFLQPVFPLVGSGPLTWLSHAFRKTALVLKLTLFLFAGALFASAFAGLLPKPEYRRSTGSPFLRFLRNLTVGATTALLLLLSLEPALLQTPRGQVSVAGFDFALANLLMTADNERMPEQSLTVVTGAVAGTFFLMQLVIFIFCLLRISQVKREEGDPRLKVDLLDNEENLFDLGLYVGLGGTVLSLILLLILEVKQDALIGAYTSTLFGILFVAALKIFFVRPYRNHLLVMQFKGKRSNLF